MSTPSDSLLHSNFQSPRRFPDRAGARRRREASAVGLAAILTLVTAVRLARSQGTPPDTSASSLEQLINTEVTTASRIPEQRSRVPSAVYVLTREDIRRSGATSIPEALRLVPGMQVARIDSNKWAIGIRGFASRLARSMLVLIDGRAVYSPLFAGTYWEVQDTLLEDVDRIEIIFGPGGTLWGANAVQGIINIITKDARDTQGSLVSVGGGTELQGLAGFRYGAKAGQDSHYRVYGKFSTRDAAFHPDRRNFDDWRMGLAGFRTDWALSQDSTLTFQGDLYKGLFGQRTSVVAYAPPSTTAVENNAEVSGGNVLGRWGGPLGDWADFRVQGYYDRTNRREPSFREGRDTVDFDFQHHIYPLKRQEFVWGIAYRATSGDIASIPTVRFLPNQRTDHLVSGFLQDDIELVVGRLRFIAGSKFERNGYSGFENQPSGRLIWTPSSSHTLLLSVARAVRTPSPVEHDLELTALLQPTAPAAFLRLTPNEQFDSEKLIAYEMGYRVRPASRLYVTFSSFFNDHADLVSNEVRTPFFEVEPSPPHVVLPLIWGNGLGGHAHGMELNPDWRVTGWWRLNSSYSYLRINLKKDPGSLDSSTEAMMEGSSPRHQVLVHSSMNLEPGLEFDWVLRFVSALSSLKVPRYATSNARLGWRPHGRWELSVVGQNLHQARHAEFSGGVETERAVYGKLTWQW